MKIFKNSHYVLFKFFILQQFAFIIKIQYNWIVLSNVVQYSPLQHPSGRRALIIPAMAVRSLKPAIGRWLGLLL